MIARPPREMQQVRCSAQAGLIAAFLVGYLIGAFSCFGRFRGASFVISPSTKAILVQIETVGATLRYLPKYSPDLNPIEMPYSKFKTFLRKVAARTIPALTAPSAPSSRSSVLKNVPTISGMQAMFQYDRNPL